MKTNHLKFLKAYFESIGKKQNDIVRETGFKQPYVSAMINGKKIIGKSNAAKLSELYGLSYSWLLTGEGEMLQLNSIQNNTKNKIMDKLERINKAVDFLRFKKVFNTQKELAVIMEKPAPNVSDALKGGRYFTDKFVVCFSEKFKDFINKDWLLTGEGEMLAQPTATQTNEGNNNNNVVGDNNNVGNTYNNTYAHARVREDEQKMQVIDNDVKPIVPKYLASQPNTDVYKVIRAGQVANLNTLRTLPPYKDFDFYYQVRQDAMQPIYMQGDVLALAHVESGSDIIQGAAMVIDTADYGFLLRRLYDRGDAYECRRVNENSAFENQLVRKDKVIRLYRVVYSLRLGD